MYSITKAAYFGNNFTSLLQQNTATPHSSEAPRDLLLHFDHPQILEDPAKQFMHAFDDSRNFSSSLSSGTVSGDKLLMRDSFIQAVIMESMHELDSR